MVATNVVFSMSQDGNGGFTKYGQFRRFKVVFVSLFWPVFLCFFFFVF